MRVRCTHPIGPVVDGILFAVINESWSLSEEVTEEQAKHLTRIETFQVFKGEVTAEMEEALDAANRKATADPNEDPKDAQIRELTKTVTDLTSVNAQLAERVEDLEKLLAEATKPTPPAPTPPPPPVDDKKPADKGNKKE